MSAVLEQPTQIDGRELRSIRTRAAIIDAWLELMAEGDLAPTAKEVADRARIGLRTVFQHFSDMNVLQRAAGEEQLARLLPTAVHVSADLPLADRIETMVANRGHLFESVTLLRRSCERQEWVSPEIHDFIDDWEKLCSASTLRVFAPELSVMPFEKHDTVGAAVDAVLSWSTWNQLRRRRGLSVEESEAVMRRGLDALLTS